MKPNDFVTFLLRSPLHGLLGNTMLITVTGRKTGQPITTPVDFARCGDELWVLTSRDRMWWRNIDCATPVTLRIQGRAVQAVADLVEEPKLVAAQLLEYVRMLPAAAGPLGLRDSTASAQASDRLSAGRLFVRIRPLAVSSQIGPPPG
jgi:deazaflavin-dependent oxidoreductase (nitroreductase family)